MAAYSIKQDGLGFSESISRKFFWKQSDADQFCKNQLHERIVQLMTNFLSTVDYAKLTAQFRNSIRKEASISAIHAVLSKSNQLRPEEIANQIISIEPEIRSLIPYKRHALYQTYNHQVNELLWLCISIRKQFKTS